MERQLPAGGRYPGDGHPLLILFPLSARLLSMVLFLNTTSFEKIEKIKYICSNLFDELSVLQAEKELIIKHIS
jgi:hypothetical protein